MDEIVITVLRTINQILTAGIAITAFSLLLYALSFNLRDRVARSFALILACVVVVFTADALGSVARSPTEISFWLHLQWVGIILLPAGYFHFSDALLETTGRPSRGRRRAFVRINYGLATLFLLALLGSWLVGPLVPDGQPAPFLARTPLTWVFVAFYLTNIGLSWWNFWRGYKRTLLPASRRRMQYLMAGALAPVLGTFPFLLFGFGFAAQHPWIFWGSAILSNMLVTALLIVMAYAVAFFGVPWPDRVVKRRLFKWLMRGPVTASTVLAVTTLIRRAGQSVNVETTAVVALVTVVTVLFMEHMITLVAPYWERYLFHRGEGDEMRLVRTMEERMITVQDLRQFLQAVLAAVCDQTQESTAFIAGLRDGVLEFMVSVGKHDMLPSGEISQEMLQNLKRNGQGHDLLTWQDYWLLPLVSFTNDELLGILGVVRSEGHQLTEDQIESLTSLRDRAALAIEDRRLQQEVVSSLEDLTPQVELIQRLRAASRYDQKGMLADLDELSPQGDFSQTVKDALSHYWGGPKLTESPLLRLQVVQRTLEDHDNNPVNALRSILREAIEQVRPEGDRRFTGEWILYNILEMKFMEGRKVREVAMRLAVSEADLYRKQKVAIEAVAKAIVEMEQQARLEMAEEADGRSKIPQRQ